MTMGDKMLTTIDNPFDPNIDYVKWKTWDEDNGYYTESYIARLLTMEPDFDLDNEIKMNELTDKVVLDVLENDVLNVYILV